MRNASADTSRLSDWWIYGKLDNFHFSRKTEILNFYQKNSFICIFSQDLSRFATTRRIRSTRGARTADPGVDRSFRQ